MNLPDTLSAQLDRLTRALGRRDRDGVSTHLDALGRLIAPDEEIRQAIAGAGLLCSRALEGGGSDAGAMADRAMTRLRMLLRFASPSADAREAGLRWRPVSVA